MTQQVGLAATRRVERGSSAARRLRARGLVPAVLYGHGREPQSLSLSRAEIEKALAGIAASSTCLLYTSPSPRDTR